MGEFCDFFAKVNKRREILVLWPVASTKKVFHPKNQAFCILGHRGFNRPSADNPSLDQQAGAHTMMVLRGATFMSVLSIACGCSTQNAPYDVI